MSEAKTVKDHLALGKLYLLEVGGVDNWEWYSESLENYGYEQDEDELVDAKELLNALENGGVDNWSWYGESLNGIDEYEEYLEALEAEGNLEDADHISAWLPSYEANEQAKREAAVEAKRLAEVEAAKVAAAKRRQPSGAAEEWLFARITEKYGVERAGEIFEKVIANGMWKNNTFPAEFKKVLAETPRLREGQPHNEFMEAARKLMLSKLEKNGKLDLFIDSFAK